MKRVAEALEVSRPHLAKSVGQGRPGQYNKAADAELLERTSTSRKRGLRTATGASRPI